MLIFISSICCVTAFSTMVYVVMAAIRAALDNRMGRLTGLFVLALILGLLGVFSGEVVSIELAELVYD